jgi:hypothetical protein
VELKRKAAWKKRYALIGHCLLTYRSGKDDKKEKMRFDLRHSKVMLGQRDNQSPYIYIKSEQLKDEAIRISFESELEFNKWLEVIQLNRKSDEEMDDFLNQVKNNRGSPNRPKI